MAQNGVRSCFRVTALQRRRPTAPGRALACTRLITAVSQVPIVFLSLLRKGTPDRDRSEAKLAEAFDYVTSQVGLPRAFRVCCCCLALCSYTV